MYTICVIYRLNPKNEDTKKKDGLVLGTRMKDNTIIPYPWSDQNPFLSLIILSKVRGPLIAYLVRGKEVEKKMTTTMDSCRVEPIGLFGEGGVTVCV